jgi:hypothetical protein
MQHPRVWSNLNVKYGAHSDAFVGGLLSVRKNATRREDESI